MDLIWTHMFKYSVFEPKCCWVNILCVNIPFNMIWWSFVKTILNMFWNNFLCLVSSGAVIQVLYKGFVEEIVEIIFLFKIVCQKKSWSKRLQLEQLDFKCYVDLYMKIVLILFLNILDDKLKHFIPKPVKASLLFTEASIFFGHRQKSNFIC